MIDPDRSKRRWPRRLGTIAPPLAAWALGAAVAALFTTQAVSWYVMTDELQHVKLAVSIGEDLSLRPRIHGAFIDFHSQLYPLLTAPFYAFLSMPAAFDAVHVFNAVAMASAAVPLYILSRELLLPKPAAALVAAASVLTPWMVLTTMVMTEVVAYPAFAWAILAIQRAVSKPTPARDALAFVAIALAFLARTQLALLAPVYLCVTVLHAVGYPLLAHGRAGAGEALRRMPGQLLRGQPFLLAAAAVAAALPLFGYRYGELLGSYGGAASGDLLPGGAFDLAIRHLDFVTVAIGVVPLVCGLGWALAAGLRPATRSQHVFALLILVTLPLLSLQVASFVLRFADGGIHDRYLFYLAPLLFVGLAMYLHADIGRRLWLATAAAAVGFVVVADDVSYDAEVPAFFASPAAAFHRVLAGRADRLGDLLGIESVSPTIFVQLTAVAAAVALPLALRHLPRAPVAAVVGAGVLAFSAVQCVYVFDSVVGADASAAGVPPTEATVAPSWIDPRVPDDADVGIVPFPVGAYPQAVWWTVEFWNKQVTRSYAYGGKSGYTQYREGNIEIDERTGRLTTSDVPLVRYLVMHQEDRRFRPEGELVEQMHGFELMHLAEPATAAWTGSGFDEAGTFPDGATVRVFGGSGAGGARRRVTLQLAASEQIDPALPRGPQLRRRYRIRGEGIRREGVLRPGQEEVEVIDTCILWRSGKTLAISASGRGAYGAAPGIPGLPVGVRVVSIRVATVPGSCG